MHLLDLQLVIPVWGHKGLSVGMSLEQEKQVLDGLFFIFWKSIQTQDCWKVLPK